MFLFPAGETHSSDGIEGEVRKLQGERKKQRKEYSVGKKETEKQVEIWGFYAFSAWRKVGNS